MTGIDHLVLCVRDLEAARRHYQAMGFTMTPPAQHPFGTGNSNIQLNGSFLEVLTVMAPQDIVEHTPGGFSFSAFNRDFLSRREGFSMLVMESSDPDADQTRFASRHLQTYAPFEFSRQAKQPDGSQATVGFSLRFATDPGMPDAAFFTCHQHAPELFWKLEYQTHANTAHSVAEVVIVSDHPSSHSAFLRGFTGASAVADTACGLVVETARGRISVMRATDYQSRYATPAPDLSSGARLAAFAVSVASLDKCRAGLHGSQVRYHDTSGGLAIAARDNFGAAIEFREQAVS